MVFIIRQHLQIEFIPFIHWHSNGVEIIVAIIGKIVGEIVVEIMEYIYLFSFLLQL